MLFFLMPTISVLVFVIVLITKVLSVSLMCFFSTLSGRPKRGPGRPRLVDSGVCTLLTIKRKSTCFKSAEICLFIEEGNT